MNMKCLLLGCGKMATAIATAINQTQNKDRETLQFVCYTPTTTSAKVLANKIGGAIIERLDQLEHYQLILIACKPQQFTELANQLKGKLQAGSVVISLMAGIKLEQITLALNFKNVVRIMPNTPIAIAKGVNLAYFPNHMSSQNRDRVLTFFEHIATSFEVKDENEFDQLTPMVGSGPALLYYFMQAHVDHLIGQGITPKLAQEMVTAVFSSSAQFAQVSGRALPELIQEVTSKGGITFAALKKFEENKLDRLIAEGYQAAYQRNSELQL
jgi:pyrroline-5-carboxylate reductase